MKKGILLGVLVFLFAVFLVPFESQAVPSYARQVKKPCTACHTIWPNLTQYGRQFKVKAYTDVSPDWEMITKDNLNLATIAPFSARVIAFPNVNGDPGSGNSSSSAIDALQLFVASRVYDYAGVFASAEWSPDTDTIGVPTVKVAFQYPISEGNTIGFVAFKGLSAAADPFNSLGGRDRALAWGDESLPSILTAGWAFDFWSEGNIGFVAHGYFVGNRLYAAIGTMRGGLSSDAPAGLSNSMSPTSDTDPYDYYARVAWDQKLSNGAITFGAAMYDGKQRVIAVGGATPAAYTPIADAKVRRGYIDASLEQNFGEDHLFEVQALLGSGKETNLSPLGFTGDERKFAGSYLEASYFYQRKFGVVASLNNITFKDVDATDLAPVDKVNGRLIALNYLPWLNTKIALQYANVKTTLVSGAGPNETDKITRIVMDVAF